MVKTLPLTKAGNQQISRTKTTFDLPPALVREVNLAGYHSIRINDQWRIVFAWNKHGPAEVTICYYH